MITDCRQVIRIAIIEDNRFIRKGWRMLFNSAPEFKVTGSYPCCEDAFHKDDIQNAEIVLMDLRLPGISGIDGIKYIKEHFPQIEILVCSAYEDDENIFEAITAGAVGFITKKAPPNELLKTVLMAVQGGSPITPNVARKITDLLQRQTQRFAKLNKELTGTELEILNKLALGKSYYTVASEMDLALGEVSKHIRKIYEKLQERLKLHNSTNKLLYLMSYLTFF